MENIRLYDEAKGSDKPSIPIDEDFKIIEAKRKKQKVMVYQVSLKKRVLKALEDINEPYYSKIKEAVISGK